MSIDDNTPGFVPPLTEDEMAALSAPPRSLTPSPSGSRPQTRVEYRAQADGDLLLDRRGAMPLLPAVAADLDTVLAFVLRPGTQFAGKEYPPHVEAALRLRAWLEGKA